MTQQCEDEELVREITRIVREAFKRFEQSGGTTRHWVRECFLPILNRDGWVVARDNPGGPDARV
jgi:hypothetical protein